MKLAFYTCFYGADSNIAFKIPALPSTKYDCYYFTNNTIMVQRLKNTKWICVYIDIPTSDDIIESCMIAKRVKAVPQKYTNLTKYDFLCYLDSKLDRVNDTFVEGMINNFFIKQNYALLLRQHPFINYDTKNRDISVWDEFNQSMRQDRYKLESDKYQNYISKQINNGLSISTRDHCACGFLIRNMRHTKIVELNNTWYSHIQECGVQDQISFFFVKQLFSDYIYPFKEKPFV